MGKNPSAVYGQEFFLSERHVTAETMPRSAKELGDIITYLTIARTNGSMGG
jgi:hypothetical protein